MIVLYRPGRFTLKKIVKGGRNTLYVKIANVSKKKIEVLQMDFKTTDHDSLNSSTLTLPYSFRDPGLGGSIIETEPRNRGPEIGKLIPSV